MEKDERAKHRDVVQEYGANTTAGQRKPVIISNEKENLKSSSLHILQLNVVCEPHTLLGAQPSDMVSKNLELKILCASARPTNASECASQPSTHLPVRAARVWTGKHLAVAADSGELRSSPVRMISELARFLETVAC